MPGFQTRLGLAKEQTIFTTTWPSAAPALVTALLPITSEALTDQASLAYQTTRSSRGSQTHTTLTAREASAPWSADLTYGGFEELWALALGFMARRLGAVSMPEELVPGAYRHVYEMDRRLDAEPWTLGDGWLFGDGLLFDQRKMRRATVAAYRGGISVWEALSAMVSRLTLSGGPGRALGLTVDMIAHSVSQTSAINTSGTLLALPVPTAPRVLWHQGVMRLAPYSASGALDAGDVIKTQGASLALDNALTRVAGRRAGLYTDEPYRSGPAVVTGSMTEPRYLDNTLVLGQRAGTAYMMDWKWTGRQIGATGINYQFNVYLPTVHLDTVDVSTPGPGRLPVALAWTAREPDAPAAGMPAGLQGGALVIEVVSASAVHPLI